MILHRRPRDPGPRATSESLNPSSNFSRKTSRIRRIVVLVVGIPRSNKENERTIPAIIVGQQDLRCVCHPRARAPTAAASQRDEVPVSGGIHRRFRPESTAGLLRPVPARHLLFADDLTTAVHHADAARFQQHINCGKIPHGCPSARCSGPTNSDPVHTITVRDSHHSQKLVRLLRPDYRI